MLILLGGFKVRSNLTKLVLAGLFLALGILLPHIIAANQQLGIALLPMHLPVLLCGFVCGWQYGLIVGFITPLLNSFLFGMPPIIPIALAMAFELAAYGVVTGLMFKWLPRKNDASYLVASYASLLTAMIAGRVVWGLAMLTILGIRGGVFTWNDFISGVFLSSVPGIVIQLLLIPAILLALKKAGYKYV